MHTDEERELSLIRVRRVYLWRMILCFWFCFKGVAGEEEGGAGEEGEEAGGHDGGEGADAPGPGAVAELDAAGGHAGGEGDGAADAVGGEDGDVFAGAAGIVGDGGGPAGEVGVGEDEVTAGVSGDAEADDFG